MNWLNRNSNGLQAIAAIITAAVAIIALVGIKLQVDTSYRVQREQSAKEIYRELLNLSIANPDLATPNYCVLEKSSRFPSYESFVDYVLYTAEQVMEMDASWSATMEQHLEAHRDYLCTAETTGGNAPAVEAMLQSFKSRACKTVTSC